MHIVEPTVQAVFKHERPPQPELAVAPGLPLPAETNAQAVFVYEEFTEPELAVTPGLPLPVGTKVQAARNFGTVKKGAPGIITGVVDFSFFWWSRPAYLCSFADDIRVHARPKQIEVHDHGYNLVEAAEFCINSVATNDVKSAAIVFPTTSNAAWELLYSRHLMFQFRAW